MAITITSQPNANTFWSSEYPCVLKCTSDNASIRYIRFRLLDHSGTEIDVPDYFAPEIGGEFTFNASDYINHHLYWLRDDLVSFDSTPTIHVYDNLTQDVEIQMDEIETDGTTNATATSNEFIFAKFKHQVYNTNGTAQEYIDNRLALSTNPYYLDEAFPGGPELFIYGPNDGRQPTNVLTDYSRFSLFLEGSNGPFSTTCAIGYFAYENPTSVALGTAFAQAYILTNDMAANGAVAEKINSFPVNISDVADIGTTTGSWQIPLGGGSISVADVTSRYKVIQVTANYVGQEPITIALFASPSFYRVRCPKTFIYINRFGVHESITFSSKENQRIVSSRSNAVLVNTDVYGAHSDDLGAYLLTGARQRAINPRSEREFTIKNTLPYLPEQSQEIALDFFASPVHYVVDEGKAFAPSATISHPDTGTQKLKRISISDGTTDVVKQNRAVEISFTYRYADII